ncbi:MAG: sodium:calcium antiporter [Candidatus Falkowbacteria bacterium]|nr:MAG: sodium:calcium antiporter [Candidatus Falkowbacteria bacterium]
MLLIIILLLLSLLLVIKSADFSIRYSASLAESLSLPKYIIGFVVVALISVLPEMFIAITSALEKLPAFGLGTLFGSNIADLTLVFGLVVFLSGRNLKIESKLIKNRFLHFGALIVPLLLGLNGYYSRIDGLLLIITGALFYYLILKNNVYAVKVDRQKFQIKNLLFLALSMGGILLGAHFTVKYGIDLAHSLKINSALIGMLIVGLGTTLPELFFSIKAARHHHDDLALGDILGTVVADATVIVGIMALISPFSFNSRIVYVTGSFMILAAFFLFYFMKSDRRLNKTESALLFVFYIIFVLTELFVNR